MRDLCSRSAYARESSSETPTKTENVRPDAVSALRTARVIHSRWLGVNESPAGTRATHVFAGVITLDYFASRSAGVARGSLLGVSRSSLVASVGTRIGAGGLEHT